MAVISPFPALRYDPARVSDLGDVIAPPYDVISHAQQEALYERHPYNVVRLILNREPQRARAAARIFVDWLERGVLRRDAESALYRYTQTFALPDGAQRTRDGVLCRLRLEDFSSGVVRPHERTLPGPKADRLALLRAIGVQLSPVFALYTRPGERLADVLGPAIAGAPDVEIAGDDGQTHRLWRISDQAAITRVQSALASETVFIADGHHRYETALAYRDELGGAAASGWVLAYLANMAEEGVVILPTHRLVPGAFRLDADGLEARLREHFVVEPLPAGASRPAGSIDCVLPDRRLRLRHRAATVASSAPPAVRGLDVVVLHEIILRPLLGVRGEDLVFTHDDDEAVATVATGRAAAAFLLNAPTMATVRDVCLADALMPEKSTYFYPKVASGLVFNPAGPSW